MFWDILLDALKDTALVLPFILVVYILIELIESKSAARLRATRALQGKFAPFVGAGLGLVPQCGFSVAATNLYNDNYIKAGTLLAVYIATSDEALPILLSNAVSNVAALTYTWQLLLVKAVFACLVGFVVNLILHRKALNTQSVATEQTDTGCCHHEIKEKNTFWHFIKHPLLHTAKVVALIFAFNLLFGVVIELWLTTEVLTAFMASALYLQPLFVGLVGLIPNCASSVLITQLLLDGVITFGAATAGLCVNAGVATVVLFSRRNRLAPKLLLLAILYCSSVLLGTLLTAII